MADTTGDRMMAQAVTARPYEVWNIEQRGAQRWSAHSTMELARKAARRYRRKNADSERWVDHYGYEIRAADGTLLERIT